MGKKRKEIKQIAQEYGLDFPSDVPIWQLSVGEQQRVEIVKTLYRGADIIIFETFPACSTGERTKKYCLYDHGAKLCL